MTHFKNLQKALGERKDQGFDFVGKALHFLHGMFNKLMVRCSHTYTHKMQRTQSNNYPEISSPKPHCPALRIVMMQNKSGGTLRYIETLSASSAKPLNKEGDYF